MLRLLRHVFICCNERPADDPRGCCLARGADAVRDAFKRELAQRGLRTQMRATRCGCLDHCEQGVTVVVYPEQVWYGHVTPSDVPEIIERHLLAGEPVERLRIDRDHPGAAAP
ncbi:MAG: (2Fe-2S) ferredoxin domain-containing protein [Phycisphaerae bacterium]|nr:(2Fe-2S) ferredoxin domain-containing protein [Phycisphaerae bacterium]MCZ2399629.1 (2Fe-2S) ferredoxin domain-containing protein [Phycisphaerae bacterium]